MDVHETCADVHWSDRDLVVGIHVFLYVNRPVLDQAGKGDELVRETGVAIFLVCLSNHFCVDDHILASWIETEKGKWKDRKYVLQPSQSLSNYRLRVR